MNGSRNFFVRRAAVLGAGVMGAQIAAHLANADVPVLLFDLPAREGDRNGQVRKAIDGLRKLEPSPLTTKDRALHIEPANYDEHLDRLAACDLIVEAIAERPDLKADLYRRIAPHVGAHAILASNTSGLSISTLAQALPAELRPRFCGLHFFNPPRYMKLVEIIAGADTGPEMLDRLETWLVSRLGKGVVRARDTPNFIANRIGVFAMLAVMHHTARLGLGFDEVDALTGPMIGRPKSATYRTADVVGLDTLAHVIETMRATLPDDPWHAHFAPPPWLPALIAQGALGQKTGVGIYRKEGKAIKVLDPATRAYRDAAGEVAAEVKTLLELRDPAEKFARLRASPHPQAQFLWAIFRDSFHYSAHHLAAIADNARDLDLALRWGFGWAQGPFETWQAAGWREIAKALADDIAAGRAMSAAPLPAWVGEQAGVHAAAGSYAPAANALRPRSALPVYVRQLFPERVLGEPLETGETIWENGDARDGVRLWRLPQQDEGIAIVSFKSKMHTLGEAVLEGLLEAVTRAERDFDGLVIWHEAPFAAGANLKEAAEAWAAGQPERVAATVAKFQRVTTALKYAQVPTVAAVQGMALGGGCEVLMHAAHRVFALESYVGLVEAGVGLIPAGGGCKAMAIRAAERAVRTANRDPFDFIPPVFEKIAMATVAKSAPEAIVIGFGRASDTVLLNADELLFVALRQARALALAGYRPPLPARQIVVAGRTGIATLEMMLVNMVEGGLISAHDYRVAKAAATALCGGDIERGSRVDEDWLLGVERRQIFELIQTDETQARIRHMLETGKPLRN